MAKGFRVEFAKSAEDDLLEIVAWYRRLLKNDASPRECAGYAQGKDAGSARSSATGATENDAWRRPVRSRGRGLVLQQPHRFQQVPVVGKRLVAAVLKRVGQLALFPDSGRVVPEFDAPWLRELEMPPYRIVYRRDDAVVTVVRVRRSERLMDPDLEGNA